MKNEYIENPKTKSSGILCCVPQKGTCPNNCPDCFFQSGRSYLEPLEKNLPNMPDNVEHWNVIRVNDGNDSSNSKEKVIEDTKNYKLKFYNTTTFHNIIDFDAPVVVTINPGDLTDNDYYACDVPVPLNLMFVRFRANMWNRDLLDKAVKYYSEKKVPVVVTFMAYFNQSIKPQYKEFYKWRKRTLNSYWAITTEAWETIMEPYKYNKWVYSCGKIEGEKGDTACRFCGNCLREYFATMERMKWVKL